MACLQALALRWAAAGALTTAILPWGLQAEEAERCRLRTIRRRTRHERRSMQARHGRSWAMRTCIGRQAIRSELSPQLSMGGALCHLPLMHLGVSAAIRQELRTQVPAVSAGRLRIARKHHRDRCSSEAGGRPTRSSAGAPGHQPAAAIRLRASLVEVDHRLAVAIRRPISQGAPARPPGQAIQCPISHGAAAHLPGLRVPRHTLPDVAALRQAAILCRNSRTEGALRQAAAFLCRKSLTAEGRLREAAIRGRSSRTVADLLPAAVVGGLLAHSPRRARSRSLLKAANPRAAVKAGAIIEGDSCEAIPAS